MSDTKSIEEKGEEKVRRCSVCGKKSETVICEHCQAVIRGEALEHKLEIEKKGDK